VLSLEAVPYIYIVTWWCGPGGTEAFLWPTGFFQCFDTIFCVIWPVKIVPEMTYNVSGMLSFCSLIHPYTVRPYSFVAEVWARNLNPGKSGKCVCV